MVQRSWDDETFAQLSSCFFGEKKDAASKKDVGGDDQLVLFLFGLREKIIHFCTLHSYAFPVYYVSTRHLHA